MAHRIDFGSARRKQLQAAGVLFMLCLPAPSEAVSLTLPERCLEAPVDVSAESADDRRFACVAAADALQLLGHCGISLRRSLRIDIVKEVRHPLSGPIFGLFDVKEEKILVAEYASIPALVSSTPYSDLPPRDFYRQLRYKWA